MTRSNWQTRLRFLRQRRTAERFLLPTLIFVNAQEQTLQDLNTQGCFVILAWWRWDLIHFHRLRRIVSEAE